MFSGIHIHFFILSRSYSQSIFRMFTAFRGKSQYSVNWTCERT